MESTCRNTYTFNYKKEEQILLNAETYRHWTTRKRNKSSSMYYHHVQKIHFTQVFTPPCRCKRSFNRKGKSSSLYLILQFMQPADITLDVSSCFIQLLKYHLTTILGVSLGFTISPICSYARWAYQCVTFHELDALCQDISLMKAPTGALMHS